MSDTSARRQTNPLAFLAGGGEMGERIRSLDWSRTPLGPVESWPQSLRSAVSILLPSKAQIAMCWGPDLTFLYNDAYRPVLGAKHPGALGQPISQVWSELWEAGLDKLFASVQTTGEAFCARDWPFMMERHGFKEETFFDISYDPVRDESGQVGGLFCIVSETTARVVGERRLKTLSDLSMRSTAKAQSVDDACRAAAAILAENRHDLPFALIYLADATGTDAHLVAAAGLEEGSPAAPAAVGLPAAAGDESVWPFATVLRSGQSVEVSALTSRFGPLPGGVWPEPAHTAIVLPIGRSGPDRAAGFLVAGVSPRRPLDDHYRAFLDLLAGQVATVVANARAYEEEKRRAEALAELDRAKTAFFSNVSHEFRTPLTLMLGPAEDLLEMRDGVLSAVAHEKVGLLHRNAQRLQKLVNTLLDFSRIEAGRVKAAYEPTDLSGFTAELASSFRSACERAGLTLAVDCPPLAEPVFVDRQMWEKVVLNLLSNAFKFTFDGGISVSVRRSGNAAELRVSDTGTGIPAGELPRLFERFHRVENARGRTHEGSGIGLALVHELVKIHGGTITAESRVGAGSTLTVTLPFGSAHLPPGQIAGGSSAPAPAASGAPAFVEEALRWLPDATPADPELPAGWDARLAVPPTPVQPGARRPRVLVADDNADLRAYVVRLLAEEYSVEAVADGAAALDAVRRRRPDLILSDVMMPRLDGFGLLRELRADPGTATIPVILLSARAGEESRVEGMQAGADDYLTKPFGARELLARVTAHVQMARLRREADAAIRASEERFRTLFESMDEGFCVVEMIYDAAGRPVDYRFVEANPTFEKHTGFADAVGRTIRELVPDHDAHWFETYGRVAATGQPERFVNEAKAMGRWYDVYAYRVGGTGSNRVGILFTDITARRRADEGRREADERYRTLVASIDQGFCVVEVLYDSFGRPADYRFLDANAAFERQTGLSEPVGRTIRELAPGIEDRWVEIYARVAATGEPSRFTERSDALGRWFDVFASRVGGPGSRTVAILFSDITGRRQAEAERERLLREVEAERGRLDEAFRHAPAFMCVLRGPGHVFERANDRYLDLVGRRDVIGRPLREALPEVVGQGFVELLDRVYRTGESYVGTGTKVVLEPGGGRPPEERFLDFVYQPLRDGAGAVSGILVQGVDLTDRVRAEAAVREGERRWRGLAEALPNLVWTDRADGTCDYLSSQWEAYTGIPVPELLELNWLDRVIHPDDRERTLACWLDAVADKGDYDLEYRIRRHDGEYRWFKTRGVPIRDQAGRIVHWFGTCTDIEDAKRQEVALREASATLRSFYDTAPIMMGVVEVSEEDILHLTDNAATGRFFGVDPQCLARRRASEMGVPHDNLRRWIQSYRESERTGQPVRFEYPHETPTGTRWVSAIVFCMERLPGGRTRCSYVAEDVTERKQFEEALRQSEERFRQLAENVSEVFWMTDPQTTELLYISPAYERVWGRSCQSLYENVQSFMDAIHPDDRERVRADVLERQSRGEQVDKEYRVVRPDGSVRWVRDRAFPVRNAEGQFYRLVGIIDDFTDRKLAADALKEADRRKDEFLATLAHELRNPLAPIKNAVQILSVPRVDAATTEKARAMIDRQVTHLVRLVDDLLDVSRVMRGKIDLRRERVEMAVVVARAVETAMPLVEAQHQELEIAVPEESLPLDADPVRLTQVLGNLLTNAAKYTDPRGRIRVTARREGRSAVLSVRDTGIGIAPDVLPHVFELFVQADHATTKAQGGLGIGLTLVKNLVEMHGGTVEARSDGLGEGSEFTVRLPLACAASRPVAPPGGAKSKGAHAVPGSRVLVVDDNQDAADSLASLLELQGHSVRVAHDGRAGLEAAADFRPDLVLLDIGMPGMDGYEVARRLRGQFGAGGPVVVALTGWGQEEDRRKSHEAGFDAHMTKPVEPGALETLLAGLRTHAD